MQLQEEKATREILKNTIYTMRQQKLFYMKDKNNFEFVQLHAGKHKTSKKGNKDPRNKKKPPKVNLGGFG